MAKQKYDNLILEVPFFIEFANYGIRAVRASLVNPKSELFSLKISSDHDVKSIQSKVKNILDGLIKKREIKSSEDLQFFIDLYQADKADKDMAFRYGMLNGRVEKIKTNLRHLSPVELIANPKWVKDLAINLIDYLNSKPDRMKIYKCEECNKYSISHTMRYVRFCSSKCRLRYNNRKRIRSGEHAEYKRKKRREGAKESYYG